FPAAARRAAETPRRPVWLGPAVDDARPLRKNGAGRHAAGECGRQRLRLWRTAAAARRVERRPGVLRPDLLRLRRLFDLRDRRGALPRVQPQGQLPVSVRGGGLLGLLAALAHFAL